MDIAAAKEQVEQVVKAYLAKNDQGTYRIPFMRQRPVILMGPPGVGKTAVVQQLADESGINFVSYSITHHTRQSALGLPFIMEEEFDGKRCSVSEYTMSEIIGAVHKAREATGISEGILFLDEVNCVSETLAPAMLQFLQYKTFGSHRLPEGWIIVTAGNPPEYNRSARDFDPAMLDRLLKITVEPDLEAWRVYAVAHGVHPAITSYLEVKPNNFYKMQAQARGRSIVTPRGWEDLSSMLWTCEAEDLPVARTLAGLYLQDNQISVDFDVYYALFKRYEDDYKIPQILKGKTAKTIVKRANEAAFDERIALVDLLLSSVLLTVHDAMDFEAALRSVRKEIVTSKKKLQDPELATVEVERMLEGAPSLIVDKDAGDATAVRAQYRRVLEALLTASPGGDKPFDRIRSAFNDECATQKQLAEKAKEGLDNAFRFVDESFGAESQEALIFLTRLSGDAALIKLVARYGSEQYLAHNSTLLFSERCAALREEIAQIDEL